MTVTATKTSSTLEELLTPPEKHELVPKKSALYEQAKENRKALSPDLIAIRNTNPFKNIFDEYDPTYSNTKEITFTFLNEYYSTPLHSTALLQATAHQLTHKIKSNKRKISKALKALSTNSNNEMKQIVKNILKEAKIRAPQEGLGIQDITMILQNEKLFSKVYQYLLVNYPQAFLDNISHAYKTAMPMDYFQHTNRVNYQKLEHVKSKYKLRRKMLRHIHKYNLHQSAIARKQKHQEFKHNLNMAYKQNQRKIQRALTITGACFTFSAIAFGMTFGFSSQAHAKYEANSQVQNEVIFEPTLQNGTMEFSNSEIQARQTVLTMLINLEGRANMRDVEKGFALINNASEITGVPLEQVADFFNSILRKEGIGNSPDAWDNFNLILQHVENSDIALEDGTSAFLDLLNKEGIGNSTDARTDFKIIVENSIELGLNINDVTQAFLQILSVEGIGNSDDAREDFTLICEATKISGLSLSEVTDMFRQNLHQIGIGNSNQAQNMFRQTFGM